MTTRNELSNEIPGFGGMFFDAAGNLVAYLTDIAQAEAARTVLARVLASPDFRGRQVGPLAAPRPAAEADIVLRQGRYSLLELQRWREQLRPTLGIPGAVSIGIDAPYNRLLIGIADATARAQVERALTRAAVPPDAVFVVDTPPARSRSDA